MTEWNYDLAACPMFDEVLLLWAQRQTDDEDMPTGKVVGYARVLGERVQLDVTHNLSWQSSEIENQPNAEFWGTDHENAMTPTAWCALLPLPDIPADQEGEHP